MAAAADYSLCGIPVWNCLNFPLKIYDDEKQTVLHEIPQYNAINVKEILDQITTCDDSDIPVRSKSYGTVENMPELAADAEKPFLIVTQIALGAIETLGLYPTTRLLLSDSGPTGAVKNDEGRQIGTTGLVSANPSEIREKLDSV